MIGLKGDKLSHNDFSFRAQKNYVWYHLHMYACMGKCFYYTRTKSIIIGISALCKGRKEGVFICMFLVTHIAESLLLRYTDDEQEFLLRPFPLTVHFLQNNPSSYSIKGKEMMSILEKVWRTAIISWCLCATTTSEFKLHLAPSSFACVQN